MSQADGRRKTLVCVAAVWTWALTCDPASVQKPLLPLQDEGERRQPHGQVEGDAEEQDRRGSLQVGKEKKSLAV